MTDRRQLLIDGLEAMGLPPSSAQIQALLDYADALLRWNKVYNLTAIENEQSVLTHHILDSASLIPYLREVAPHAQSLLDVGSGGGLPSIPTALFCPDLKVSAVDAVQKKVAFLTQMGIQLRLRNYQAIHQRVEKLQQTYDVVTCRAFASLKNFTTWTYDCLKEDGLWIAMKGVIPEDEIAQLDPQQVKVESIVPINVPQLNEERHFILMRKAKG